MKFHFFLGSFLAVLLILAGCSSIPDCSAQNTQYVTYAFNEDSARCEVVDQVEEDVCGNGVQEDGETYCNCQEDVNKEHPELGCFGEKGEYLENMCVEEQCVVQQNDKVVSQTKQLEFRNSDFTIKAELEYNSPYITSEDVESEIGIRLELFSTNQDRNIKNIRVQSVEFFNRDDIKLAESNLGTTFSGQGSVLSPRPVEFSPLGVQEDDVLITVVIPVTYTVEYLDRDGSVSRSEQKTEDLRESLGRVTFINPAFIE